MLQSNMCLTSFFVLSQSTPAQATALLQETVGENNAGLEDVTGAGNRAGKGALAFGMLS